MSKTHIILLFQQTGELSTIWKAAFTKFNLHIPAPESRKSVQRLKFQRFMFLKTLHIVEKVFEIG